MSFLRNFHDIVSNQTSDYDTKIHELLKFGLRIFKLDIAIISAIKEDVYRVEYAISPDNSLEVGTTFDAAGTYCIHTLNAKCATSFHHASESDICSHPCYLNFGLESYIGAPIVVNDIPVGTVNFSSANVSPQFTQTHIDYIELLAQWLGAKLLERESINKLEKSTETLKKLETVGKIGTWEVDIKEGAVYWSDQTRIIHEVDDDYIPNLTDGISFYREGESQQQITKTLEKSMATGEPWGLELELVTAKGNYIWVATHGTAEFLNGECVRLFGTFQDITEDVELRLELEKKKREAESALKDKSTMFAKVSHELRTPLNGVHGMLNALVDETNEYKRQEKLNLALRSSQTLLKIINEVLDYSKITYGDLRLKPNDFLLEALLNDFSAIYAQLFEKTPVFFQSVLSIPKDCWVHTDEVRISQILSNLLSNAFKFTEKGSVCLTATAQKRKDVVSLDIQIRDTGCGMTDGFMQSIFTPFSQDSIVAMSKREGSGLGLSIVKELVTLMGGTITVTSKLGSGSCFDIKLDLVHGNAHTPLSDDVKNGDHLYENIEVLVVDDIDINRVVLGSCLETFNIEPVFAIDGEDAISKCQEKPFDLIFMDCVMPGLDGLQTTKILRAQQVVGPNTVIAAVTANTSDDDKAACIEAGMDIFIAKPFQSTEIQNAIIEANKLKYQHSLK
jgi:signal transduction histidine kinase/CheY-like chemotaxis protein